MKQVTVYTDGACSGNPGPGGWASILEYGEVSRELSGGEAQYNQQPDGTDPLSLRRSGR